MARETVRLNELAEITRRTRDTIRNMQNQKQTPWDEAGFPEEGYRRYSGLHALSLVIAEMLVAQGVPQKGASEFVRIQQGNIERFLTEVADGKAAEPRFVTGMFVAVEDSWVGPRWMAYDYIGTGTAEEIVAAFSSALAQVGTVYATRSGRTEERRIGGPHMSVASIPEAYRLLKLRAEEAGYVIDGYRIIKIAANSEDE